MNLALMSMIFSIAGWIVMILVNVFLGGKDVGEHANQIANVRQDVQDLHEALSTNSDMHNENYQEMRELVYKIKAAVEAFTGKTINGVSYRRRD